MDVMRRCWSTSLDPMAYQGDGPGYFNDRVVIDACRPYDRIKTFPAVARLDAAEAQEVRERWSSLFTADGRVARDVRVARPTTADGTASRS
jgi:4-hydroxy-3-polyprenylbenzoate decarboxylase